MHGFFKRYRSSGTVRYHSCGSKERVHIHNFFIRYHPTQFCTLGKIVRIFDHQYRSKQTGNWLSGRASLLLIWSQSRVFFSFFFFFFDDEASLFFDVNRPFFEMYFKISGQNFWKSFSHFRCVELHNLIWKYPKKEVLSTVLSVTIRHHTTRVNGDIYFYILRSVYQAQLLWPDWRWEGIFLIRPTV